MAIFIVTSYLSLLTSFCLKPILMDIRITNSSLLILLVPWFHLFGISVSILLMFMILHFFLFICFAIYPPPTFIVLYFVSRCEFLFSIWYILLMRISTEILFGLLSFSFQTSFEFRVASATSIFSHLVLNSLFWSSLCFGSLLIYSFLHLITWTHEQSFEIFCLVVFPCYSY